MSTLITTEQQALFFTNECIALMNNAVFNVRELSILRIENEKLLMEAHEAVRKALYNAISYAHSLKKALINFGDFVDQIDWAICSARNANNYFDALVFSENSSEKNAIVFTYIVQNTETGNVKIGKSINPKERLKAIRGMSGNKLVEIALIPENMELALHKLFSNSNIFGEWFKFTADIASYLLEHQGNNLTLDGMKAVKNIINSRKY
jgi:hypothetical protein